MVLNGSRLSWSVLIAPLTPLKGTSTLAQGDLTESPTDLSERCGPRAVGLCAPLLGSGGVGISLSITSLSSGSGPGVYTNH